MANQQVCFGPRRHRRQPLQEFQRLEYLLSRPVVPTSLELQHDAAVAPQPESGRLVLDGMHAHELSPSWRLGGRTVRLELAFRGPLDVAQFGHCSASSATLFNGHVIRTAT